MAVLLLLSGLALPIYAASIESSQQVLLYIMSIHLGIYIIAQWITFEFKAIDTEISLYTFEQHSNQVDDYYHKVVFGLPLVSALTALLSFLILI